MGLAERTPLYVSIYFGVRMLARLENCIRETRDEWNDGPKKGKIRETKSWYYVTHMWTFLVAW